MNFIDWQSLAIALVPINALVGAAIATSDDPYLHSPLAGYTPPHHKRNKKSNLAYAWDLRSLIIRDCPNWVLAI